MLIYKGELRCCYIRGVKEECDKNKNFDKGSSKGSSKREGNKEEQEEDCFVNKDFKQEEAREEMILFKLTKRVAEHMKK